MKYQPTLKRWTLATIAFMYLPHVWTHVVDIHVSLLCTAGEKLELLAWSLWNIPHKKSILGFQYINNLIKQSTPIPFMYLPHKLIHVIDINASLLGTAGEEQKTILSYQYNHNLIKQLTSIPSMYLPHKGTHVVDIHASLHIWYVVTLSSLPLPARRWFMSDHSF